MRASVLCIALLGLGGCAMTKGTMLDGTVCTIANSESAKASIQVLVDHMPDGSDKDRYESYLHIADISATALCELRRGLDGQTE